MAEQPSTCPGHPILYGNNVELVQHDETLEIMGSHDFRKIIAECLTTYLLAGRVGVLGERTHPLYIFRTAHNLAMGKNADITLTDLEELIDWKGTSKYRKSPHPPHGKANRLRLTLPRLQRYLTLINNKVKEIIDMPLPTVSDYFKFKPLPKSKHFTRNPSRDYSDKHTDNIYKLLFDLDIEWYAPLKAVCVLRLQVPDCEGNYRAEYILMKGIYHYLERNVFPHLTQDYEHKDNGRLPTVLYREFLDQERGLSKKKSAETKEIWKAVKDLKAGVCMIDLSDNVITPPEPEGEEKKE